MLIQQHTLTLHVNILTYINTYCLWQHLLYDNPAINHLCDCHQFVVNTNTVQIETVRKLLEIAHKKKKKKTIMSPYFTKPISMFFQKLVIQLPWVEQRTLTSHQDSTLTISDLFPTNNFIIAIILCNLNATISYRKSILLNVKLQRGQCN